MVLAFAAGIWTATWLVQLDRIVVSRFEGRLFSATEVPRGKPHPDLFLYAAERMGFAPDECVVVEDSRPGVLGARAAGMHVFGYAGRGNHAELEAAGAVVVNDMAL